MKNLDLLHSLTAPGWKTLLAALRGNPLPQDDLATPEQMLALLEQHRLVPWFYRYLLKQPDSDIRTTLVQAIKPRTQECQRIALKQLAALVEIQKEFTEHTIPLITLKGVVLSQQLYGDISVRQSGDIDILVPKEQTFAAHELLLKLGYRLTDDYPEITRKNLPYLQKVVKDICYFHPQSTVMIEMHNRLPNSSHWWPVEFSELWQGHQKVTVGSLQVAALSDTDNLLYLCFHAAKHIWEREQWLQDIGQLIETQSFDWSYVIQRIKEQKTLLKPLLASVYLLNQVYAKKSPELLQNYADQNFKMQNFVKRMLVERWNQKRIVQKAVHQIIYITRMANSLTGKLDFFYTYRARANFFWLGQGLPEQWMWGSYFLLPVVFLFRIISPIWRR